MGDQLQLHMGQDETDKTALVTSLAAVIDQDNLVVNANVDSNEIFLRNRHNVQIVANVDSAGILKMRGRIKECTQNGDQYILVVELINEIEQTQRREHYRLPLLKDVHLGLSSKQYQQGMTQNLSAGGLRCVVPQYIRSGATVKLKLDLDETEIEIDGKVLETISYDEESEEYILRIKFMDLSREERRQIHTYIFKRQCRRKKIS